MYALSAALVSAALLATGANAAINSVTGLVTCQPTRITWDETTAPYFLTVIPGGQPSAAPLVDLGTFPQGTTSYTWTVNLAAGTNIGLALKDATGNIYYSGQSVVAAGSDTSCVGQPIAGASSSAAASGASSAAGESSAAAEATSSTAAEDTSSAAVATSSTAAATSTSRAAASSAAAGASSAASAAGSVTRSVASAASSAAAAASSAASSAGSSTAVMSGSALVGAVAVGIYALL